MYYIVCMLYCILLLVSPPTKNKEEQHVVDCCEVISLINLLSSLQNTTIVQVASFMACNLHDSGKTACVE